VNGAALRELEQTIAANVVGILEG